MIQNGQTAPKRKLWVTRRRTWVRRAAQFVRNKKGLKYRKIEYNEIFLHFHKVKALINYENLLGFSPFCGLDFFTFPLSLYLMHHL